MPVYDYRCLGHDVLRHFPMGEAPTTVDCPDHQHQCPRRFGSQQTASGDHFRSYHLSGKRDRAAEAQGRAIATGPRDKFEAAAIERETGRIYIGDDSERLSDRGRQAVNKTFEHNETGAL